MATSMEVDTNRPGVMASTGTSGSVSISLHPLVIMNISEHWTRVRSQEGKAKQGIQWNVRWFFVETGGKILLLYTKGQLFLSFFHSTVKRGSSVVRHLPLVLEVPGLISAHSEKHFGVRTRFL